MEEMRVQRDGVTITELNHDGSEKAGFGEEVRRRRGKASAVWVGQYIIKAPGGTSSLEDT